MLEREEAAVCALAAQPRLHADECPRKRCAEDSTESFLTEARGTASPSKRPRHEMDMEEGSSEAEMPDYEDEDVCPNFESEWDETWDDERLIRIMSDELLNMMDISNMQVQTVITHVDPISIFYCKKRQEFPVEFYVRRLVEFTDCSTSSFLLALIYIDRVVGNNRRLLVNEFTVHRLLITALVIAVKFLDDKVFSNEYYSKVGGLASVGEINKLEATFLNLLNFRTFVSAEEFSSYERTLAALLPPMSPLSEFVEDAC